MIENHFGKPGSGKSYSVFADVILPALKSGSGRVLTNIDGVFDKGCRLRLGALLQLTEDELNVKYVGLSEDEIVSGSCWSYVRAGDIYVIDECQRYWPGGVLKPTDPIAFRFFGEHRHLGCHIHCITINPANFQSSMRSYAEISHQYKKLGVLGLNSRFCVRDYGSSIPGDDTEIAARYRKYDKSIFQYYKSVTEDGNNIVGKQKNILRQPRIIAMILFVLIALPVCFYRIHKNGLVPMQKRELPRHDQLQPEMTSAGSRPSRSFLDQDQPEQHSYTAYGCLTDDVCYLRLADGSVELVRANRQPGGLVWADGRAFLPGGAR